MEITLIKRIAETTDIASFLFKTSQVIDYKAGQYTRIFIEGAEEDNRSNNRFFTLSSAPTENDLMITTRMASDGSLFKRILAESQTGSKFEARPPRGDFILPDDASIPIVMVAAGVGVTPFRSMIKFLLDTRDSRDVHLIYAGRNEEDFAFKDLFAAAQEKIGLKVTYVPQEATKDWVGETGKLDKSLLIKLEPSIEDKFLYISGPEKLVERLEGEWQGISKDIMTDYFPGYSEA